MYVVGHTGIGDLPREPKLEAALVDLIVARAGLEEKVRGSLSWELGGRLQTISVETYDSFGECCFRLKFRRPKRRSQPRKG